MTVSKALLTSALTAVVAMSVASPVFAAAKEKCYGVSMAGKNDCAGNGHNCAGQTKLDKDAGDWKYVAAGSCTKMGGSMMAPEAK